MSKDALAKLRGRFSMEDFLTRMIDDLRSNGCLIPDFPVDDPVAFRSKIKRCVESAVASQHLPAIHIAGIRQLEACVNKLPAFGAVSEAARRQKALDRFHGSERSCRRANRRIAHYARFPDRLPHALRLVFDETRHLLWKMLGDLPDFEDFEHCGYGPGLTYGQQRDQRNLYYKISGDQTVTPRCRKFALEVLTKLYPRWMQHLAVSGKTLTEVQGNRITFVPKSSDTHRTIAIEPSLNVLLQNGVDRVIRRRAQKWGLHLDDQDYSIERMQEGFREGSAATIDLSCASDSVCIESLRWLLPPDWFDIVDHVRSEFYTLDKGETFTRYEKFSSMGNGTTFPLESILFFALARVCTRYAGEPERTVRVYGDDIICHPRAAALLIEALAFLGFKTNTDKTFIFGRFRECCGTDIYDGIDVRPVYIRSLPKQPDEVANLYNRLVSNRFGFRFVKACCYLRDLVDKPLWGPSFLGSGELTKEDLASWYAGKTRRFASYFFGDPPSRRHYDRMMFSHRCDLEHWYRKDVPMEQVRRLSYDDRLAYFLYGGQSIPLTASKHIRVRTSTHYGYWPDSHGYATQCGNS